MGLRTLQMLSRYRTTADGEPARAMRRSNSPCDRLWAHWFGPDGWAGGRRV